MSFREQNLLVVLSFLILTNCYISVCNTNLINTDEDPGLIPSKRDFYKRDIRTGLRMLLKGATLVKNSEDLRLYYKSGGYKRALEDFSIMKPTRIKQLPNGGRLGEIGNLPISLIIKDGQPRLTIPARLNRVFVYTAYENNKLH